ncbi:MAG: M48 family metalloprotease [Candidatus Muirbacterium halophilum]|nr:M48 family metalloprotease [Candidatus Muirbacterium halophilum]MCK9476728.1 M48 family metalloprotease [Candidatus Muirbacterium halophilum]
MKCPCCGSENFKELMTTAGVLVDYCEKCNGVWLDKGEIFYFSSSPTYVKFKIENALKESSPSKRINPKTGKKLLLIKLGDIEVDIDGEDGGMFFDKGELERIPGSKNLGFNIKFESKINNNVMNNKDIKDKSKAQDDWQSMYGKKANSTKKRRYKAFLKPLPNLALVSINTVVMLYALLGLIFITLVEFEVLSNDFAFFIFVVIAFVQFVISSFIMDLMLRFFYKVNWLVKAELPENTAKFIEKVCKMNNMKFPKIGVIPDGSPNAFTYGHTPNNARIIITNGMFKLLGEEELNGVIAHEIGHAVHWDMLLMTIAKIVPMFMYYIYRTVIRVKTKGKDNMPKLLIAAFAYLLYILSEYVVLWFSRVREYYADRFAGKYVSPNSLSQALVKIGYGLAGKKEDKNDKNKRNPALEGISTMGIFDAKAAKSFAISSFSSHAESMGDNLDKNDIKGAMRWDLWNPWAGFYEISSTHPLIAKRIDALSRQSIVQGEEPYIEFDERKPESYWDEFFIDMFIGYLPEILIFVMMIIAFGTYYMERTAFDIFHLKGVFVIYGLAIMIRTWFSYKSDMFPEMNVSSLLKIVKVSGIRGVPVTIKGKIIGRGIPGYIFSEDFIIQDQTGIIFLDYKQPLRIFEFFFAILRAGDFSGQDVTITGWFRRAPVPYIEILNLKSSFQNLNCYVYWFKLFWGVLCIIGGILACIM